MRDSLVLRKVIITVIVQKKSLSSIGLGLICIDGEIGTKIK